MNELVRKELSDIPRILREARAEPLPAGLLSAFHEQKFTHGIWLARGSSKNAAMWMSKVLLQRAAFPLFHLPLSAASLYKLKGDWSGILCAAISKSGSTPEILESAGACRDLGASVYGITSAPGASLVKISAFSACVGDGGEKIFSTKSFVAMLFHAWRLADAIRRPAVRPCEEIGLDRFMEDVLRGNPLKELKGHLARVRSVFVLGRGFLSPIASEMAMKFKEWCVIPAEAVSGEEFLHGLGGFAGQTESLILVLLDDDETLPDQMRTLRYLSERKANVLALCPNALVSRLSSLARILPLPDKCSGLATGFAMITAFYRSLLDVAESMGLDLDSENFIRSVCPASFRQDIASLS